MDFLQHIDQQIYTIVQGWGSDWGDVFIPLLRNPYFWAPVYLYILVWMWTRYKHQGLWWCAFFFLCFVLSDFISASIIKPFVMRPRPCRNPELMAIYRGLIPCGGGYSFPSSHAANHFSLAVFIMLTLGKKSGKIWVICIAWASAVCFAQLYVGVHYLSDLLAGAILGAVIAWLLSGLYVQRFGQFGSPQKQT
ncbi:MAG: phosphatase PAP2 family protein [Chitinophagaceae bacterium]|jgi:undecaprenyl-diphosphatase